ncbi:MAG: processing protein, partial [Actinomycetota bacterium]|nr:processing protein [Actinomycetota bacterium]
MSEPIRRIVPADAEWCSGLNELGPHQPPEALYLQGLPLEPEAPMVAIVGTRHPTMAGIEAATAIAHGLAEGGFVVVSGFARGIDAAAHKAALLAGGRTIAVLGCGIDVDYPRQNKRLRAELLRSGTFVSEYPEGTQPAPWHFPLRNRIVAGLCRGVVVVEGGLQSGALVTARLALDADRSVYAVPGSLRNGVASGPNHLIKTGRAALVTTFADICDDLAPRFVWPGEAPVQKADCTEGERKVLEVLDDAPAAPDRIARALEMPPGELALALAKLEVRGWALKTRGGYAIS